MSVIGPDRPAGRRAHARLSPVAFGAALLATVAAACSSSSDTTAVVKATTCKYYACSVSATAAVGDTVLFNVRVAGGASTDNVGAGEGTCDVPNLVKVRIAAISQRAIIAVDTRNPVSGFSDASFASIAQTFDTLVYPVDTRHFGVPLDIDQNGRIIAFYTRAVNGLTPASSSFYIGGFFYGRDLFPTTSNTNFQGCAGSNAAEMFYLLAPDPTGAINGNVRDTALIRRTSVSTVGHEFQHLISAERRLYVLNTQNFDEEVWLNEGMSHVAEELNFYRSANLSPVGQPGQSPRSRLAYANFRGNTTLLAALNGFQTQNNARFSEYLGTTETFSPYTRNDSLETRGATWSFLRYAIDRAGSTDSALTYALVNSPDTGLVNLRNVLAARGGSSASLPLETWFRDWAIANYADSVSAPAFTALPPQYTYPSWIFRSTLTKFTVGSNLVNNGVYPLATRTIAANASQTVSLTGGGAAYFTFTVPAASSATFQATVGSTALPSTVRLALVQASGPNAGTVTTADGTGTGPGALTLSNTDAASIQGALVVFNAATPASATQAVTVTESGTGTPLASASPAYSFDVAAGPTRRALALAAARDPIMSDAGVMLRLRESSRAALAPRVMGAQAAFRAARRSGDYSAWARPHYVPGSVKGLVVPASALGGTR